MEMNMYCRFCNSEKYVKHGLARGKQRFLCKKCNKHFVVDLAERGYSIDIKIKALLLLKEGLGFRATARYLKISNTVVLKWFKNKSFAIKELLERNVAQSIKDINVVEIDELRHYTQKTAQDMDMACCYSFHKKSHCL
jgi:transposase-like protein